MCLKCVVGSNILRYVVACAQYTHGIVWLYYENGAQLGVKVTSPSYIVDISPDGQKVTYRADDEIPASVRHRVANDLQASMARLNMLREG